MSIHNQPERFKTIENTVYIPASIFKRFVAMILDGLIVAICLFPINKLFSMIFGQGLFITIIELFNLLILPFILYAYLIHTKGTTMGKHLLGLKVIDSESKEKPTFPRALLRELVGKTISGLFFLLGYIWAFFSEDKKTWHDLMARTFVVQEE
jgi:uncharacterized RDD family membrane protein YckC